MQEEKKERRIQGIAVSPGFALGRVHLAGGAFETPEERAISADEVEREVGELQRALVETRRQIAEMQDRIMDEVGTRDARIFDAHLLVLEDASILDEVVRKVREQRRGAAAVFYEVMSRYMDSLRRIDDSYLSERAVDIQDVAERVVGNLEGRGADISPGWEHILVAHDLTPSDTANMDREKVVAFATEWGSPTSHTAIMARSLGIPAVVGLHGISDTLHSGQQVLLDGYHGLLITDPAPETVEEYRALEAEKATALQDLHELRDKAARTADGEAIVLSANIEFSLETPLVVANGAQGVGLFRTEFMFLNRPGGPPEDEQAAEYRKVVAGVSPGPVIFRTVDIGGDKVDASVEPEPNPFLGWRGIRASLGQEEMFKSQLRAILRASAEGPVGVMFPLISNVAEVRRAKVILARCREELEAEGVPVADRVEVGAMIEIPSAALTADLIAPEVDFFSIGTNDLVQYTIAVDRVNDHVAYLFQPSHPAVLRLIKNVVDAGKMHGCWVGVCGEIASDLTMTPVLIGLGIEELSVGAALVPRVKSAVRHLDAGTCRSWVRDILEMEDPDEIHAACREMAGKHYPELVA